jgi:hypothetical protein
MSSACYLFDADFLLSSFFDPEYLGDVPPKRRLAFNGLHGAISRNTEPCKYV